MFRRSVWLLVGCVAWLLAAGPAFAETPPVRIGTVFDGPSDFNQLLDGIVEEIRVLTEGELDVRFEPRHQRVGDWTRTSVEAAVSDLLADDEVDLVLSLGPAATQVFCCRGRLGKPVIAAFAVNAALQGFPRDGPASGVENLNYLDLPDALGGDLARFRDVVPFETVTVALPAWLLEIVPSLPERMAPAVEEMDLHLETVGVGFDAEELLARIGPDVEALYVLPLVQFSEAERRRIYGELARRGIPTFSTFGVAEVEEGALAGQREVEFYRRLERRIALNVQRVLLGEDPGSFPVTLSDRLQLTLNLETARRAGVDVPYRVLAEAVLLHERPEGMEERTLFGVVDEAIEANLDLEARRRGLVADATEIDLARANWGPQLEAGLLGLQIDEDRAATVFSTRAERTLTGSLSLSQLVYSEPALANVAVQRHLYRGREAAFDALRLDIARDAAVVYLGLLRAETFVRIRRSNLDVTRENLQLARARRELGSAGPGETYRWEAELASSRRDLVQAQADVLQARIALNRLLHRDLATDFVTREVGLDDPRLVTSHEEIYRYAGAPGSFALLADFTVEGALRDAPELAGLDAALDAQRRSVTSRRRAFWSPEVGLQLGVDHLLTEGGAGTEAPSFSLPGLTLEVPDDTSWSLALQGSLSLFEGRRRSAALRQAEASLAELTLERRALAERIEQAVRSRLHEVRAAFESLELSREGAEASANNFRLVSDAYGRGLADVLDLLDAQSAQLVAELAVADARYRFLIELVELQRTINRLDFFLDPGELGRWFDEMDHHFRERGYTPRSDFDPPVE